jgi:hypothetical protein
VQGQTVARPLTSEGDRAPQRPGFFDRSEMNLTGAVERDWRKTRESILRRDKFKCVECEKPCHRDEADIHHVIPRSAGGSDEPSNLITLCDGCHAAHHPKLAAGLARREIDLRGSRGSPIDQKRGKLG